MSSSISAAQRDRSSIVDIVGDDRSLFTEAKGLFAVYGDKFKKALAKYADKRGVVDTGAIIDKSRFEISEDGTRMDIIVPDYFDFPNEGVRGVNSSKNAPNSPYKFKSYGMNAEGRAQIRDYISRGRAKIDTVKHGDKAFGIGREGKHKPLLETQTDQLIYLIKRYGIKATHYFTDALNDAFSDFEVKMTEAVGRDIVFTLEKITLNGNNNQQ
jgi:hypothetical protein